jgi:hypothetical protein
MGISGYRDIGLMGMKAIIGFLVTGKLRHR